MVREAPGDANGPIASVSDLPLRGSGERKPLRGAPAKREKEILEAAVNLFYEAGYAGTSVEHVARAVGMLKGSLYHYIDTKEDLLYRIVEQVHEDHNRVIADVRGRSDQTPLQQLDEYLRQEALYHAEHLRRFAVYWRDRQRLSPERYDEIMRWRQTTEGFMRGLIQDAIAAGELPDEIDAALASNCARGVFASLHTWYDPAGPMSPPLLAEFLPRFLLDGIRGGVPGGEPAIQIAPAPPPAATPAPAAVVEAVPLAAPEPSPAKTKRKRRSARRVDAGAVVGRRLAVVPSHPPEPADG